MIKKAINSTAAAVWKVRYAQELRRLLKLEWRMCWYSAGEALAMVDGDLTECPLDMAQNEFDEWRAG